MYTLYDIYARYIDCLNAQDWSRLGDFVSDDVVHNGRRLRLGGYQDMLVKDFEQIPDLHFEVALVICEGLHLAARLHFDVCPRGEFMGLEVNGRRVSFTENVFYRFADDKIVEVWSVIDKAAIEAQLRSQ